MPLNMTSAIYREFSQLYILYLGIEYLTHVFNDKISGVMPGLFNKHTCIYLFNSPLKIMEKNPN